MVQSVTTHSASLADTYRGILHVNKLLIHGRSYSFQLYANM